MENFSAAGFPTSRPWHLKSLCAEGVILPYHLGVCVPVQSLSQLLQAWVVACFVRSSWALCEVVLFLSTVC